MNRREAVWLGLLTLAVGSLFLRVTLQSGDLGFPLDDAWIHQTYARYLAENGRWEFVPGVVSSGSTAPLWTMLLAVGYGLRLPYLLWAYLLGGLVFFALAHYGMRLWQQLWPSLAAQSWAAGLVLVTTWPLLWAAVSGMETVLFGLLGVVLLVYRGKRPFLLGLLSGLLILTRPDGIVLVGLLLIDLVVFLPRVSHQTDFRARLWPSIVFLSGFLLLLLPYFGFNWWSSGHLWPTTFYAKQAEYAVLLTQPLWRRAALVFSVGLGSTPAGGMSSPHLLLLPGLLFAVWQALRRRSWRLLLPLLWAGGHLLLYALRLPLVYQHGRYLLPVVPIWLLYGLAGWWGIGARLGAVLRKTAVLSYGLVTLLFLFLGANAYAQDVAFVQGEMVATAHWLAHNVPDDALIATHDIGAIGYFAKRPLLDLAGLLSPEVVPLLPDEAALVEYALAQRAAYLVTAPGWPYAGVEAVGTAVYTTNYSQTDRPVYNNMTVYRLKH